MKTFSTKNFKYGVVNAIEPQSIPDGAAADSLNWLTQGDKIELSRGSDVIGTETSGSGRVTGVHIAYKSDGTAIAWRSRGQKVEYYDTTTSDWVELGSDILGADADGEDVSFANYNTNAGAQLWICSPKSSLFKVMTANPDSYADMYSSAKNFKGLIAIKQNRMWLWGRDNDKTGLYGSFIDTASYTTVTAEATTSLTGTLAFKAGGAMRTCFGVAITITGTGEVYTDDYNGILTGDAGGTGTINYMTGEYTLSNAGVGTADYQWEDSTSKGIADFTKSATRLAGEGFIFRQDDGGGDLQGVFTLNDTDYCFHENKTWALTLTADDTNATNLPFRYAVGIPSKRAAISSSVGIFYIDNSDGSKPRFRKLYINSQSEVSPKTVTENIKLDGYIFDDCQMFEWSDYILFTGRTEDSTVNNRLFMYHKTWGSVDIRDYYLSKIEVYNGALIGGESISNNVLTLFSGFDDSDSLINNYWEGRISDLQIENVKKVRHLWLEGEIQTNQSYDVYIDTDRGGWTLVGTIEGTGSYVDVGNAINVGANTIGSKEIGGGGDDVEAYHYLTALKLGLDKFENRQLRFVAQGIGYVSITRVVDHDIRLYAKKLIKKYR
uniref:Uncharacterized protein n=1 Tax=viral metagenome TaxID=1070528 RepID=A0A6H1ZC58_9ZZZZ